MLRNQKRPAPFHHVFPTWGPGGKAGQVVKSLRPSYKVIIEGMAVYVQPEEGESVAR